MNNLALTALVLSLIVVFLWGFKLYEQTKPVKSSPKFYEVHIRRQFRDNPQAPGGDRPYETEAIFVFDEPGIERHPLGGIEVELKEYIR